MSAAFLSLLLIVVPLTPLLGGWLFRHLPARTAARAGILASHAALLGVALSVVHLATAGRFTATVGPLPAEALGSVTLRLDVISAVFGGLVAFLGTVVTRFSRSYMAGDPRAARYHANLSLTLGAALALAFAGNLLVILLAWVGTSLGLHQLLLHFRERPGAVFAARKKFLISRLGDTCLLLALVHLGLQYGTWDLDALFARAAVDPEPLALAGWLFVACAALKSAQFPFHSWLPDTLETPTPVSAFMHAGIVNAGGFLLVRLHPLLAHAGAALAALAVLGAVTAAFGAVVMLTQPTVKRALAYSTIAQMGFMLLQCGLGAFGLALLHIVAHALYKAHAFLRSGSTIGAVPRLAVPLATPALVAGLLIAGGLTAGVVALAHAIPPAEPDYPMALITTLGFAVAYGLARSWSAWRSPGHVLLTAGAATAFVAAGLILHALAANVVASAGVAPAPTLQVLVALVFAGLFALQAVLWRAGRSAVGRQLHVHALNGFYLGTLANRILARLWPYSIAR